MAIAFVRSGGTENGQNVNTDSDSFTAGDIATGNHLILTASGWHGSGIEFQIPTDNQSHTWANDRQQADAGEGQSVVISSVKVTTSSGTFTVTVRPTTTSANYICWNVSEFSGLDATTHLDKVGGGTGTNGTPTATASGANATANALLIGTTECNWFDAADLAITSSGWSALGTYIDWGTINNWLSHYKIVSSTETSTIAWSVTQPGGLSWAAAIATYKAASGATEYDLTLNSGSYALTGNTNSLLSGRAATLESGTYTTTGSTNSLLAARSLALDSSTYTVTGSTNSLLADRVLELSGADYDIDGSEMEGAVETGPWGAPPVLTAYDTFNRADGDLDGDTASDTIHTWTVHAGGFDVVSNEVRPLSASLSRATLDTNISDVDVTLRVVTTAGSSTAGILLRYIDENNYLAFMAQPTSCYLQTRVAGSDSFTNVAIGIAAGTTYRVRAVGNKVAVFRTPSGGSESTLISTQTINDHVTAVRVGITAYRQTTLTVDDLNVYNLTYLLALDSGSYTISGQTNALAIGRALTLDTGSYALTGSTNSLLAARTITLDSGSYTITGFDNNLSTLITYSLTLDSGSYSVTGSDASFLNNRALLAESGIYTLTGSSNSLLRTALITLVPGSYTTTGFDTGLLRGLAHTLDTGSYSLTGSDLTFTLDVISFSEWAEITTLPSPAAYTTTDSHTELATFNNVFQYTTYRV